MDEQSGFLVAPHLGMTTSEEPPKQLWRWHERIIPTENARRLEGQASHKLLGNLSRSQTISGRHHLSLRRSSERGCQVKNTSPCRNARNTFPASSPPPHCRHFFFSCLTVLACRGAAP